LSGTLTGNYSKVSVTGSLTVLNPNFSGIGGVQVILSGQNILISGGASQSSSSSAGVTGISISGGPSITVLVSFTGIGGLLVTQSGQNVVISGSAGSVTNNNTYFINSGTGVVFTTGDQNIYGQKFFYDSGSFANVVLTALPNSPLEVGGSGNTYIQINLQNIASGDNASTDLIITASNGTDSTNYLDLGLNNPGYNQAAYQGTTGNDGYLYVNGGGLTIGTQTPGKNVEIHVGGTTDVNQIAEFNDKGLRINSGSLTLVAVVGSGNPVFIPDTISFGAEKIVGDLIIPRYIEGAISDITYLQPSIDFDFYSTIGPNGTSATNFSTTNCFVTTTTASTPVPTFQTVRTRGRRMTMATAAASGNSATLRVNSLEAFIGNSGQAGFSTFARFALSGATPATGSRVFVGLVDSAAAVFGNSDLLSATLTGKVGVAANGLSGNQLYFISNTAGVTPTAIPLGSSFPLDTGVLYESIMYSHAQGSGVYYRVSNVNSGITATGYVTTNLPSFRSGLARQTWVHNGTVAAITALDLYRFNLRCPNQ
jgi:hypothetical protein